MKIARHAQIIKLINQYDIETQEELAKKLEESGFAVTQATISRDIRQLKLTKVPKENGGSRYAVLQNAPSEVGSRYARVLKDAYISVDLAKNILVIKTVSGMAMAAAAAFDEMNWNEIVGRDRRRKKKKWDAMKDAFISVSDLAKNGDANGGGSGFR